MADWPSLSLRKAGVSLIDCVHKTPAAQKTGYPYVGIPQMKEGWIDFDSARKISLADYVEWTKKAKPQANDVILSRRTNPGVTAIDKTSTDFALGQNLVLLRSDGNRVNQRFLKWMVRTPAWWGQIDKFMNVGAVFNSLKCADVPNFELPIPPLGVQQEMCVLLDAFDDKIELNRRMNETLEAMARAIFKDWFVDFGPTRAKAEGRPPYLAPEIWDLFPDALDDEGKPVGWDSVPLLDLCELKRGYDLPKKARNSGAVPIVSSSGPSGWHDVAKAKGPGIVTGRYGTIGKVFTCVPDFWPLNTSLYVRDFKGNPFWFVFHTLCRLDYEKYSDKGAVPGVNRNALHTEPVSLPPARAVQAFEGLASSFMSKFEANQQECETLSKTRDLLLPKLMSAEIRLHEAEKEVEAFV